METVETYKLDKRIMNKSISFTSAPIFHLIAFAIAMVWAFYCTITYKVTYGTQLPEGTWMVLGGFSLFVPLSAFTLPFVFTLLFYFIFSARKMTFTENRDTIEITERYLYLKKTKRSITKNAITYYKLHEGHIGLNMYWVVFLGVHMFYVWNTGMYLLTDDFSFGFGPSIARDFMISGFIDLIMILLIILPGQDRFEVRTASKIYSMTFNSLNNILTQINGLFGVPIDTSGLVSIAEEKYTPTKDNKLKILDSFKAIELVLAILIFIITGVSRANRIFIGLPLRIMLNLFAFILIIHVIKSKYIPLSSKFSYNAGLIQETNESVKILVKQISMMSERTVLIPNVNANEVTQIVKPQKLNSFLVPLILLISLFMGWTASSQLRFLSSMTLNHTGFIVINTLLGILVMGILVFYLITPMKVLNYNGITESEEFYLENKLIFKNPIYSNDYDDAIKTPIIKRVIIYCKHNKKIVLIRIITLGLFYLIGILMGIIV